MITLCRLPLAEKCRLCQGGWAGRLRQVPGLMSQLRTAQPQPIGNILLRQLAGLTEQPLAGGLIQRLIEDAASPLWHRPVGGQLHIAQQFGAQHGL